MNEFYFNNTGNHTYNMYISKRAISYPKQKYDMVDADVRMNAVSGMVRYENTNISYECFIVDDVRNNVSKLLTELSPQHYKPGQQLDYVHPEFGYWLYWDTYDTGIHRLARVKDAPVVEFLPNYAAARVKITFACLPQAYIWNISSVNLVAGETVTVTAPYITGMNTHDAYPVINTRGHGTIWIRPKSMSGIDYHYPGRYGYIITIDDNSLFDYYDLRQDMAAGTIVLRNKPSDNIDPTVYYPRVHWSRADSNGQARSSTVEIPRFDAGFMQYDITTTGTISGSLVPRFWGV